MLNAAAEAIEPSQNRRKAGYLRALNRERAGPTGWSAAFVRRALKGVGNSGSRPAVGHHLKAVIDVELKWYAGCIGIVSHSSRSPGRELKTPKYNGVSVHYWVARGKRVARRK